MGGRVGTGCVGGWIVGGEERTTGVSLVNIYDRYRKSSLPRVTWPGSPAKR